MHIYSYMHLFAFPFPEHWVNHKPCFLMQMVNWKIRSIWSSDWHSVLTNKPSRNGACCLLPRHGWSRQILANMQQLPVLGLAHWSCDVLPAWAGRRQMAVMDLLLLLLTVGANLGYGGA